MSEKPRVSVVSVDSVPEWLKDPEVIVFAGEKELPIGAVERHGLGDCMGNLFGRNKAEVQADLEQALEQIHFLIEGVLTGAKNYTLSEITFELGFSAEGKIAFIAQGGIEATISATFTRQS